MKISKYYVQKIRQTGIMCEEDIRWLEQVQEDDNLELFIDCGDLRAAYKWNTQDWDYEFKTDCRHLVEIFFKMFDIDVKDA